MQLEHCSSIGNTPMEQQHVYYEQKHYNFHLGVSDLFATEQTSVMQLEHCSSIGNTSMNNNMNTMNNSTLTFT
jgi:hypothetical protein